MTAEEIAWMNEMAGDEKAWDFDPPSPLDDIAVRVVPEGMAREYNNRELDALKQRFIIKKLDKKTGFEVDVKFNIQEFVEWLMYGSGERFITIRDSGDVYIYRDGVYVKNGDTHIKELMRYVMDGYMINNYHKNEVVANVREQSYKNRDVFEHDDGIINLANGLYDMDTGAFSEHTPDYISLNKSAVIYDPDATCPNINKFLSELSEPEHLQLYYEMAGYALSSVKRYKVGFILIGANDTGKSKFMNLMVEFVGSGNASAVQPSALASYEHASVGLYGKLINVVDDLGTAPLNETGNMKAMIGDGMMNCNPKGRQSFPFRPNILNIWGCNALPTTNDKNFGDKFILLKCLNRYGGHSKPDIKLLEKITTPEELSGFFNKAMAAFKNVAENGKFTFDKSDSERKEDWLMESTPIAMFVRDRCSMDNPEELTPKNGFDKAYQRYVQENGLKHETARDVKTYLKSIGVFDTKVCKRGDLYNIHCWLGIRVVVDKSGGLTKTRLPPIPEPTASNSKNAETDSSRDEKSTASTLYPHATPSSKKTGENNGVRYSNGENLEAVWQNKVIDSDSGKNEIGGSASGIGGSEKNKVIDSDSGKNEIGGSASGIGGSEKNGVSTTMVQAVNRCLKRIEDDENGYFTASEVSLASNGRISEKMAEEMLHQDVDVLGICETGLGFCKA